MARDTRAWPVPAPVHAPAVSGLILTAQGLIQTANTNGNFERAASYQNLIVAAEHFRRVLMDFNPQADSAVLTQITALLALV